VTPALGRSYFARALRGFEVRKRIFLIWFLAAVSGIVGCGRQESPLPPPTVVSESRPVDEALLPDGFAPGWQAVPGSYIYAAAEDELWKIYDGAAPGVVNQGGREAVTQAYENRDGGDRSFRLFILRFVNKAHALGYLEKEIEGAKGGEKLDSVDAGDIFDKGKAPWGRFVAGCCLVSTNWEGSDDDSDNTALAAVRIVSATLAGE
jgi:hypothetical protein